MNPNDLDYSKIRRVAEERFQRDKMGLRFVFFLASLIMFAIFAVVAWGFFNSVSASLSAEALDQITGALVMLTIAGGIGVLFHFVSFFSDTKWGGRQMRERAYGRALNEAMMQLGDEESSPREKVKHMMRLSEDGELEEIVEDRAQPNGEPQVQRQTQR